MRRRRTCTWAQSARSASTSRPTARCRRCRPSSSRTSPRGSRSPTSCSSIPSEPASAVSSSRRRRATARKAARKPDDAPDPKEYFGYKRDLESLCEFMGRWLSENGRWGSPVFIAGESYGGYRVGRLARMLQETAGIGLNGAILISPALEITGLDTDRLRRARLGRPRSDDGRRGVPSRTLARVPQGHVAREGLPRVRGVRDGGLRVVPHSRRVDSGEGAHADTHAPGRHPRPAARHRGARRGTRRDPHASFASSCATSARCSVSTTRRSRRPIRSPIATSSRGRIRRCRASAPRTRWR